jgi:hypothetical protein
VEPALKTMEPKLGEEILKNMQEDGTFNVSDEDYKNKKARAALNLKFKDIWTGRVRKMVDMPSTFYASSIVNYNIRSWPFAASNC